MLAAGIAWLNYRRNAKKAAKLNPARWADNVRLTGAQGDGPVQVDVTAKSALVDGLLAAIAKPDAQD